MRLRFPPYLVRSDVCLPEYRTLGIRLRLREPVRLILDLGVQRRLVLLRCGGFRLEVLLARISELLRKATLLVLLKFIGRVPEFLEALRLDAHLVAQFLAVLVLGEEALGRGAASVEDVGVLKSRAVIVRN